MNFHEFFLFSSPDSIYATSNFSPKEEDQRPTPSSSRYSKQQLPVRDSNSDCESNEFLKMWFDFRKTSTTFIQLNFLGPVMKLLKAQWIFPKQTDMTRKNFVKGSSYFIMKFF